MLKSSGFVQRSSSIIQLSPFLDENGLIRVGGRLRKSNLDYDAKHQILLPKKNFVTSLIIRGVHLLCLHGGPRCTESVLRQTYWVINSQIEIKKVVSKCVTCFRHRAKPMKQIMADLPAVRSQDSIKPFTNCAVDFTGAIPYKLSKGRGSKTSKAYIAVFVCMSTRAMHLELVTDMSANGFIAAFRRMVARRGMVANMYSDNGTNFVRANKDLHEFFSLHCEEFLNELASKGTSWHFSPAGGPHFNGLAEAAVKTVKTHLFKTIGHTALTYEELCTLLYQVEACANSRPICAMSTDPNDTECLTPGHFL
ncbi:uncharacterized protein LOC116351735, partial [Contarinia nasturtii]|uniref:uncharacterized protein LOC116351735 n=1 Tax=Contarinia nasturtii TaxID=265458 RepID=UPI0012D4ABF3